MLTRAAEHGRGRSPSPQSDTGDAPKKGRARDRLRILAVSQHYWPEPFNFADICEGLVARGYEVTVLTGVPNYPEGSIYKGYERGVNGEQEHNGVHIRRVDLIPRGRDIIHRVLNYYSFSVNATRIARTMGPGFDVVLSFQSSPVMMAHPALAYGKKYGTPVLLYCIDIWPECLTVGGIRRGSLVYRHYQRVSRAIYSAADRLAITSPKFADYFRDELGISPKTPLYLPQYAEDLFAGSEAGWHAGFDPTKINLTFAGNIGTAQSILTLAKAARFLADDERFSIHVVGSGSEVETLKEFLACEGLDNVTLHGRLPLDEMPSIYASSDAMVATFQNGPLLGYTLPRKIQSYMASSKPILGAVIGEARRVIEEAGCGLCCDAEDAEGLASICRGLAALSPAEREAMGMRGRSYYETRFSRETFLDTLEQELLSMRRG